MEGAQLTRPPGFGSAEHWCPALRYSVDDHLPRYAYRLAFTRPPSEPPGAQHWSPRLPQAVLAETVLLLTKKCVQACTRANGVVIVLMSF